MISPAMAQVVEKLAATQVFGNEMQVYLLLIQFLWVIVVTLLGFFVRQQTRAIEGLGKKYDDLHKQLLVEYATKKELVERVHGLRDTLGIHSTWIHLLAMHSKMALPRSEQVSNDPK